MKTPVVDWSFEPSPNLSECCQAGISVPLGLPQGNSSRLCVGLLATFRHWTWFCLSVKVLQFYLTLASQYSFQEATTTRAIHCHRITMKALSEDATRSRINICWLVSLNAYLRYFTTQSVYVRWYHDNRFCFKLNTALCFIIKGILLILGWLRVSQIYRNTL
jgi:hypothetical protein